MRTAAEAMEKALVLDDIERWRLFVVERAQPGLLAAAPGQPDAPPDQIAERDPAAQLVEKAGREGHYPLIPLPGLVPGIHVFLSRARKDVGGQVKPTAVRLSSARQSAWH